MDSPNRRLIRPSLVEVKEQAKPERKNGQGQGQMPGQQFGQSPNNRDPLGRSLYNQGGADLYGERVPTDLDLGHARAIMEELQRRASQRNRPSVELDYLQRLLRRF